MEFKLNANFSQANGLLLSPNVHVTIESRGTGKSADMGFTLDRLNRYMPGAVIAITGVTFGQLLTKTLPSTFKMLNKMGYERDVNFVVGKKPLPWFSDSYEMISKFDNIISFSNGTRYALVSQTEKGSGRGANTNYEIVDEAALIDKEQYDAEVSPTNRGNDEYFKRLPFNHGFKFSSSMPATKKGRYLLDYAKYYEEEKGVPIFDVWNRIVKMQLELLTITGPKQFAELWNEISRVRQKITPFISKDGVLFTLANVFDNLQNVGLSYLKREQKKLPPLIFLIEMMNYFFDKVEDCFYSINEDKQLYYTGLNDQKLIELAHNTNYDIEALSVQSSVYDNDCNPSLPLEIVPDWQGSIDLFCVCQERNFDYAKNIVTQRKCHNFINEFFVKPDENDNILIDELCSQFTNYYKHHQKRVVHYYRDRYGDSRNPNVVNSKSFNAQAIEYLKKKGWDVIEHVHKGMEPPMSDKYLLWGMLLKEADEKLPLIRFNASKCKYTLISMNNAMLKDADGKLVKDKSSERKTSGVLPEEATHFSDAADKIVWTKYGSMIKPSSSFIPYRFNTK